MRAAMEPIILMVHNKKPKEFVEQKIDIEFVARVVATSLIQAIRLFIKFVSPNRIKKLYNANVSGGGGVAV